MMRKFIIAGQHHQYYIAENAPDLQFLLSRPLPDDIDAHFTLLLTIY